MSWDGLREGLFLMMAMAATWGGVLLMVPR
jgi:hypothetical protein